MTKCPVIKYLCDEITVRKHPVMKSPGTKCPAAAHIAQHHTYFYWIIVLNPFLDNNLGYYIAWRTFIWHISRNFNRFLPLFIISWNLIRDPKKGAGMGNSNFSFSPGLMCSQSILDVLQVSNPDQPILGEVCISDPGKGDTENRKKGCSILCRNPILEKSWKVLR